MCPVGAVSTTTNPSTPSATTRASARKTAISCRAGRAQVLLEERAALGVELLRRGEHLRARTPRPRRRVDAVHAQRAATAARPRVERPAGSVVVRWTRSPRSARSAAIARATVVFPTPPLPIVRTTPWPAGGEPVDQSSTSPRAAAEQVAGRLGGRGRRVRPSLRAARPHEDPHRLDPDDGDGDERQRRALERRPAPAAGVQRRAPARLERERDGSPRSVAAKTPLTTSRRFRTPRRGELVARPVGLGERRHVGPRDEDDRGRRAGRRAPRRARRRAPAASRGRRGARGTTRPAARVEEPRSTRREARRRRSVWPGRRRVEDDVVERRGRRGVAEQPRELVERGDLDGARARELLLDASEAHRGQHATLRPTTRSR